MHRLTTTLLIIILLAACIDRIELPIRTEQPRLVIEGQITNEAPPYTIRLTYTGKYDGSDGQNPNDQYANEAQVSLSDETGRSVSFIPFSPGIYRTNDTTFRGQVGREYTLSVILKNGFRYVTKPERMPEIPLIDSISSTLIKTGNLTRPYASVYTVNTTDPIAQKNYYRWTGYGYTTRLSVGVPCSIGNPSFCNYRCWTLLSSDAVNVYSDDAINGNPIRGRSVLQVPIYAIGPQLIEIQQYGITQTNYQFWKLYQQQNSRTGSIFDPLPAPVVGNLVNVSDPTDRARGYFAVTSVTRKRLRQQNFPQAVFYPALLSYISGQIIPDGDCRATYGYDSQVIEPEGW